MRKPFPGRETGNLFGVGDKHFYIPLSEAWMTPRREWLSGHWHLGRKWLPPCGNDFPTTGVTGNLASPVHGTPARNTLAIVEPEYAEGIWDPAVLASPFDQTSISAAKRTTCSSNIHASLPWLTPSYKVSNPVRWAVPSRGAYFPKGCGNGGQPLSARSSQHKSSQQINVTYCAHTVHKYYEQYVTCLSLS